FFQQDALTWNNEIHCSFCETKQETAVRASISKAPKIIIFHLKRSMRRFVSNIYRASVVGLLEGKFTKCGPPVTGFFGVFNSQTLH
ncbi:USP50 isoform 5, partial [Pan troglodytes]